MASNYWDSTQAKYWTFTKPELDDMRRKLEEANQPTINKYSLPERRLMNIYFQTRKYYLQLSAAGTGLTPEAELIKLGRRMNIRQQALATAQVYIRRFYTTVEIRKTNPYLLMATAVYLACKMEECPQHIRLMLGEAARQWPELGVTESSKIGECEFALISTLSSRLILHHPYRPLAELAPLFNLTSEEKSLAHNIINDSYATDLPLLYSPTTVAISSIFVAVVLRPANSGLQSHNAPASAASVSGSNAQSIASNLGALAGKGGPAKASRLVEWLAESSIDMDAVVDSVQEIVSLYELWENYSERACKEGITRFMKDSGSK